MPIHQNVAELKIEIITLVDGFNFVLFLVNPKKEYACSFKCISGKTIKYKQQTAALIAKFPKPFGPVFKMNDAQMMKYLVMLRIQVFGKSRNREILK